MKSSHYSILFADQAIAAAERRREAARKTTPSRRSFLIESDAVAQKWPIAPCILQIMAAEAAQSGLDIPDIHSIMWVAHKDPTRQYRPIGIRAYHHGRFSNPTFLSIPDWQKFRQLPLTIRVIRD